MIFINPNPAIPNVPFRPDLADVLSSAPNQPIALFPVRLETRYFTTPTSGFELRVRVYPDKVHLDTHEPELTDQELAWGKHFWEQSWRAGPDDGLRKLAWQQLAERFGAQRAAWVARALGPLNPDERPTQIVAADQPLPTPVRFPTPAGHAESWTRAPQARALPSRWYVLGYLGGALTVRAAGNPIPETLAAGPNPNALLPDDPDPAQPPVDDGMKWMIDFDEAERVGMGIRVKLTSDQAFQGFDILMVVGTKSTPSAADSTRRIADLLDAHHYTDGLGFILNGTPSNNTPDAPSGFSTADPGEEASYAAERAAAGFRAGDGSNADALAGALGLRDLDARAVASLANGSATEQLDARHMNRALWGATFGYYLPQMLGVSQMNETPMSPADFKWGRAHFIDYVRASGPLPAIRIGKQPYGVLPVTSLSLWKPKTGQEAQYARDTALKNLLLKLREMWRRNLSQVPRVGRSGSPNSDLADIFAMDGISSSYAIRHLIGPTHLFSLWSTLIPTKIFTWWDKEVELTRAALNELGLTSWDPRLAHSVFSGSYLRLNGPTIQSGPLSEAAPLQANYIDLLLNALSVEAIRQEAFPDPKPRALLYSLLRHAMLLEYWNAAANLSQPESAPGFGWQLTREQELATPGGATPTIWELLSRPIPGVTTDPAGTFLHALRSTADPDIAPRVAPLLEFRESLGYLKGLSSGRLQRAFAGTLDLCSHRLDAWFTSFATKRLAEIRGATPGGGGTLVGGYGWVMNLKPAAAPPAELPPAGESGVFYRPPNNPGFTHTPSLAQAATAAVLRSGHLTHSDPVTRDLLAIDLSSERVRLATWLLDGVRQGQPIGALLGYRFERRLHDAHLDAFIPYFRNVAPLAARKMPQTLTAFPPQSVESIAANNVVDGLALQRQWKSVKASPVFVAFGLRLLWPVGFEAPPAGLLGPAANVLTYELDQLDASVDAVSDALVAETVHHAVQGNPMRTASTLDAIASGEAPPPELDVVATPRTGIGLTYRLVTLFGGPVALPAKWAAPLVPHRLAAEPYLSVWAAKLLGDPTAVRCPVEWIHPTTGAVMETRELRLSELRLGPLDLVYAGEGSRDAAPSEIEQRLLYAAARKAPAIPPGAILRINPTRQPTFAPTDVSYAEFVEVLRTARRLITGVRGIDAGDLDAPAQNQAASVDIAELTARADRADGALRSALNVLTRALATPATTVLDALRDAIMICATFGIAGAVPFSATGDSPADRATLLAQGASVVKELAQRADQLAALKAGFNAAAATPDEQRDHLIARLRATFGKSFVALPRFTAANSLELERALADSVKIQDNDSLAAATWFQRASRVRDGVSRLDASLRYAESLETGERLSLRVAQLPYRPGDRWVALPLKRGQPLSSSRFSLVVQALPTLDVKLPMTGILIDEWVEVMPNPAETTGLVFQYDQPDAAPPQSILLAVPPDPDTPWNLWQLQQVLLETLDLSRIRAVDPDTLDEVGHYLPAMHFAANVGGDTVSTDFAKLK
ncbi:MAG TPA: hypothetical protein VKA84_15030 [Gemmatimonadaceae bacterium]|nr:hypothetical protein [Gemmatimonadaceae bacterium]